MFRTRCKETNIEIASGKRGGNTHSRSFKIKGNLKVHKLEKKADTTASQLSDYHK